MTRQTGNELAILDLEKVYKNLSQNLDHGEKDNGKNI